MTYDPRRDGELRSGAYPWHDEEDALTFGHGEGGISRSYSARLAEEILADPFTPTPPPPGPRRNRHLDGDGYGQGR